MGLVVAGAALGSLALECSAQVVLQAVPRCLKSRGLDYLTVVPERNLVEGVSAQLGCLQAPPRCVEKLQSILVEALPVVLLCPAWASFSEGA